MAKRQHRRRALSPPDYAECREAYYRVLQDEDPEFMRELKALYGRICDAAHRWPDYAPAPNSPPDRTVRDFCGRWLPRRPSDAAYRDVWQACQRSDMGYPLLLQVGFQSGVTGTPSSPRRWSRQSREDLYRLAWQLYLRLVHKQPSSAIAQAIAKKFKVHVSSATVRGSTLELAAALGFLPLPEIKGRPRKV